MNESMSFFQESVEVLKVLVAALGTATAIWGIQQMMEGYEHRDAEQRENGLRLLLFGSSLAVLGPGIIEIVGRAKLSSVH